MSKRIEWERTESVWKATPEVIAAWTFGSAQSGWVSAGSDVDIGVLMESPPSLDEQIDLLARLQAALQFEDIDLVVMGTHGRKGLEHVIFGSVAENVVKKSTVPVMTVNPYKLK